MEEEKKEFKKEEIIKLLAIVLILIALFVYSVFSGNKRPKNTNENNNIYLNVNKLFEPIDNNYELIINKTVDDKEEHIEYINDGTFKLYNINNDNKGYLIYNNKTYLIELKGRKIKEYTNTLSFVDDNFSNINFIKKVVNHCTITNLKRKEADCEIKISDYLNEYNNYFY